MEFVSTMEGLMERSPAGPQAAQLAEQLPPTAAALRAATARKIFVA
jgi:hypothetical protein